MADSRTLPLVLGRYELHSVIATGGMASIHLGRLCGPSGFTRTVAVKRLHPHYARDPDFASMFLDEARLVARIRHPNVVPIVDVVAESDELFLVMEYVHGESLARLVHHGASQPVPPAIAAAIFVDVLHGLHAAHDAKTPEGEPLSIVHRDVTPHNVLVGVDGSARIADFGIAKATQRSRATDGSTLKGKLCYVAPEQLHGREVNRTTDVYSAAVSLWEALTGRLLFAAENEAHVYEKILTGAARPPSALAADVPLALDEIVMRGLAMKPHKRFASAQEMALELEKSIALPSAAELGAWVQSRAEQDLAKRMALIESLERGAPVSARTVVPPPPRRGAKAAVVALVAFLGTAAAVGGALFAAAREERTKAPAALSPGAVSMAVEAPASEPAVEPVAALSSSAPSPPKPPRVHKAVVATSKPTDDACKPPYMRDETGRKIYKRECL
ncbi:serine/threonine protein kinase [Pendulispora brunnea]|uniref:Serine/threonine protein kinase n=1 Tax=Pendulispora brunnea TaxID=2905690 RepID=A0ABZ2JZR2_9BACT